MSAARKTARAPQFTTYVDTEVDIDPEDLEEAGWVYVGNPTSVPGFGGARIVTESQVVEAVHRWHDEAHPLAWVWCDQRPCKDVRP